MVFNLRFSKHIRRLIVICLLLLLFLFIHIQLQKIIANHYFLASKQAGAKGVYNESLLLYNYSKDTGYSHREYDTYFADSISYLLIENEQKPYLELELKLKDIENTLNLNTYDDFFVKARINSAIGEYDKANENYYQAISLSKNISKTYLALADNYYLQEKFDEALENYNLAIDKMPSIDNEDLNDEHREQIKYQLSMIFEKQGDVYFRQDKYNEAILVFKKAYNYNLYQVPILKKIADSYYLKDDINMAIWYNEKGKQRSSSDPAWPTALAWLYFKQGNIEEAKAQLKEALSIRPDYSSAIDLKKELNFNF
jgi:tetratricopeptide (TPR) repeat protein